MYLCLSALAESSSGRCGTFVCNCWMMLRADGCLNEDPGPLPGPRNVCHLNFIENLRILGPYYGITINDRDLCFCMLARYMLKAKTVQYEVLNRLGSWFSRYPIFKVYIIMYNSAGKFSTNVETIL